VLPVWFNGAATILVLNTSTCEPGQGVGTERRISGPADAKSR